MNKIKLEELRQVVPIIDTNNIQNDELFDYFRIVNLNNKKYEDQAINPLYFLSYNTKEEIEAGWFGNHFDLRSKANEIMNKYPQATFVIEKGMERDITNPNSKYIIVESIPKTIDDMYTYFKEKSHAKIISVTGSVGKTTTVGLIEAILRNNYHVLRIYSKRITPIILKANIINFLNPEVDFIVLENSIYYHDHVKKLCELLKPDVACMLNIDSSHLNVDILNTLDDICIYKSEILRNAKIGLINASDEHLKLLNLEDSLVEYNGDPLFYTNLERLEKLNLSRIHVKNRKFLLDDSIEVTPFILSNLSKIQYLIAYRIGEIFGIEQDKIINSMNNYQPVENRLNTKQAFGKEIIFDGDITTYERMKELANSLYDKTYLVLRKVGSSENTYRIADIIDHFDAFEKVYIFDDVEYLNELKDHPKVEVVNNHNFLSNLDGKIIYHYSGFYRSFPVFDENKLNVYDREKYIIKRKELKI